jgi:SAM-dependent methyltransferase
MADATIPHWVKPLLACPGCHRPLVVAEHTGLACACGARFVAAPLPIFIRDDADVDGEPGLSTTEFKRRWQRQRDARWIGDDMIAALPSGATVLSAGEGYGELVLQLAQRRPDVHFVAMDLSRTRIECAARVRSELVLDNVWVCVADVAELPFVDHAFDVGYARGLLHVVPRPLDAIGELRRVVKNRLLVDQLANDPWGVVWFWLLQRWENVRARIARRAPDPRIFGDLRATRRRGGTFRPLFGYRPWFRSARRTRMRANCVFVWETNRHHGVLGWLGYAGAIDVWLR